MSIMENINREQVTNVHHWNDKLFSFTTTRNPGFRFENGHFTMLGLDGLGLDGLGLDGLGSEGKPRPIMRAYSIASANYEDQMEFLSIKVPDGPLTSRLQNLKVGDEVLVSKKPTGTLTIDGILPGRHLYLLSTGTGLAPFLSIIKDPDLYQRFEKIVLVHGVRYESELAYKSYIENELVNDPYIGEQASQQLIYYPTVTREPSRHNGRITELMTCGKLFLDTKMPLPAVEDDRFLICGSMAMIKDITGILTERGYSETRAGTLGQFAIERAFVG